VLTQASLEVMANSIGGQENDPRRERDQDGVSEQQRAIMSHVIYRFWSQASSAVQCNSCIPKCQVIRNHFCHHPYLIFLLSAILHLLISSATHPGVRSCRLQVLEGEEDFLVASNTHEVYKVVPSGKGKSNPTCYCFMWQGRLWCSQLSLQRKCVPPVHLKRACWSRRKRAQGTR